MSFVAGVMINFQGNVNGCLDVELYERAKSLLRKLVPPELNIPYKHRVEFEDYPGCMFPPRVAVYVDVSKLLSLNEECFYPTAFVSLYFDKIDRPIVHIYKRFSIIFGGMAEDLFREELLSVLREVLERNFNYRIVGSIFSEKDKVQIEMWLVGDEIYETKRRLVELINIVLYVVQRCPWVVSTYEYKHVLTTIASLEMDFKPSMMTIYDEPDFDILKKVDLDRLSEDAKKVVTVFMSSQSRVHNI